MVDVVLLGLNYATELAEASGLKLEQVANVIRLDRQKQADQHRDRSADKQEKDLIRAEVAKLPINVLQNLTSREIAAQLVQNGIAIRPTVQGVQSVISRTRNSLLLAHAQHAQAAE